ncbi:hypothetical protein [Bacillus toyonensis]|uniref:hypothetical protein n=1 Tax=Bacillus toyonensis TaxID=155322 RepID=UPI000BEF454E|nr:hypothetical protein [Bacillus toyonensis]PEM64434.1 hypothetical protein CN625_01605 [Bacillus toyonensis]
MDILKNYARMINKEPTEVTSVRIPKSLHRSFKKHCENYGLGIAEAINILIRNELGDAYKQHLHEEESNKLQAKPPKKSSSPQRTTPKSSPRSNPGRFLTTEYQVDGDLPCPICGEWKSSTNFSRHVKVTHNKTTQEIFTENHEKAISMVKARTSQM